MSIRLGMTDPSALRLGTTAVSKLMLGTTEIWSAVDADAQAYFEAIVAAGSSISDTNKAAVNAFIVGCKADGIWTAIKAACFLAGPNDLTGALVPLVGTAPTNVGPFVAGDYNRTTGLIGNASTKYLDSNRNSNTEPQDNFSMGCWITAIPATTGRLAMGAGGANTGASTIASTTAGTRNRNATASSPALAGFTGYVGTSRSSSASYTRRVNSANTSVTQTSETPINANIFVFRTSVAPSTETNARMSFYHIGESLDLALLDARLATYMSSIA